MTIDLKTSYMGLSLPHPLVVGASPLVDDLDQVRRIEDAGAAALVMHSLFEEQILHADEGLAAHIDSHEDFYAEATSYFPQQIEYNLGPEDYIDQIGRIHEIVSMPVIGSLNGIHLGSWVEYARHMETAGVAALEINLYDQPTNATRSARDVENEYAQIVEAVCQSISIPVAVKLSPFFTSLPHLVHRLKEAGAEGLVLFNRFYQPDIDVEELEMEPRLQLSDSSELLLRLRWLAILYRQHGLDLACSGGVHRVEDLVKALMSGADIVQVVSCLLRNGPGYLAELHGLLLEWMETFEYQSVEQMKGSMSYQNTPNPEAIERANYVKILQSWKA